VGIAAVLDKAGPALATGIILALLTGAASVVVAWRDLSSASAVRFGYVTTELERLRADLESFRAPGGRFTSHDGDRHWQRMDEIDKRLREQEMRPPRLNPALDGLQSKVADLERAVDRLEDRAVQLKEEQQRLCDRLAACKEPRR
jgi:septal ring factor EnvC (AmiA/AmiB activator)